MQLIRHLPDAADRPTAVAIGNFDGLHLGHQAVIRACVEVAHRRDITASVLTFEPHPRRFFGRLERDFRLERLGTKLQRLRMASIARVYMPRFDARFAALTAEEFLNGVLRDRLGAKAVITGENFAFGKNRGGSIDTLRDWGAKAGVEILTIPPVKLNGLTCSSSAIRDALVQGDMPRARALLGRDYALSGTVVHGDKRGRTLGYPTANVALPPLLRYPAHGIYAVRALVRGVSYGGAASFGLNPTIGGAMRPRLEVHLFDTDGDLYGMHMEVHFIEKLRDEAKFDTLDALVAQMAHDCVAAKAVLARNPQPEGEAE